MKKWLVLMACVLLTVNSLSQTMTFQSIGLRQGLSNGFVVDMDMDNQGFLWVATESGLNRISGQKCTTFTTANSNILRNECSGLCYDKASNSVWVYYKEGDKAFQNRGE